MPPFHGPAAFSAWAFVPTAATMRDGFLSSRSGATLSGPGRLSRHVGSPLDARSIKNYIGILISSFLWLMFRILIR